MKIEKLALILLLLLPGFTGAIAQSFSFGMCTDVHYADIPSNGTRKYRQSIDKLTQCVDSMNQRKVSFLIELGDFKDMPVTPDSLAALVFLRKIESVFSRFRGERYHVLGNHDEDCISKEQFCSVVHNSHIATNRTWYSFQKNGYQFVVLDACFDSTGHAYNKGNFIWSDTNIPQTELKWLSGELKIAKLPVIVFVHQPLSGSIKVSVGNREAVRTILEKSHKVKCVFQGHEHAGGYALINGIHYYTLKGMIEGDFPESNSFAIVTLTKDEILIHGYGKAVSLQLPIN